MDVIIKVTVANLGKQIKEQRIAAGLSPAMVAAAAKMSVSNLYLIESQKAQALPKETLEALSDAIGCDFVSQVYRIVCGNEHMSSTPSSQS